MNNASSRPASSRLRTKSFSNTWQTTIAVMVMVTVSVVVSIWFFWRSLYLPELKNHARYLTTELKLVTATRKHWGENEEVRQWILANNHVVVVEDPSQFPDVSDKALVGFFTDVIQEEISKKLGHDSVVYFKFKPTPQLWVQDTASPEFWIREPVIFYAQYSPSSLIFFLLGIPLFTLLTILLLVRQLNRPLRKLQQAATNYIRLGSATTLPTNTGTTEIRRVNMAFNRLFSTLNQAQKERTIMLAGISHDLRTPLTRMRLTAEMLPDEFFREGLIYDIEDMDAILEQFISFMKDGSDEAVSLTNLDSIFREIMVQFAPLEFIYQTDGLREVAIRPLSIKRLIINLIVNAQRYGKPPIYLTATITPTFNSQDIDPDDEKSVSTPGIVRKAKEQLIICVRDCGPGVANDQLERIMQPFERGESARTTQGSGLGLAIVQRIAGLHHGTVEAINHPEGGLQVCVRIPLVSQTQSTLNDDTDEDTES
ncbi:ATP-binding protein [Psychrobacter sanguinis]|uniref:ATP-binding protein n=1 Tax=Psychrobacter sanguinis TaxID=861445 RepID=UPI00191B1B23|nr:ATP-binding protein [Psychrobacter sanguinis]MCC3308830.1 two-component sensor histidine kinase [Psychrobacter sanguinis]UEC26123.1 two-component sensor histidine kinase [Psychrobacter sanguinis]